MGGFGVVDYIVFVGTLAVSLLIGVYFAFVKKQTTSDQILVGNRDMSLFPVTLSLLATYMSAILMLGVAGEIYANGTLISEGIIGALIFIPLSGVLFLPTLYHLKLTSAYEYLELRFESTVVRLLTTATFIIQVTLYTGIVLYAPALALKAILDIPIWISVVLIGGLAGIYTSVGGIQAVVWTDAFQIFMMFAGMFAIIIQGSINVGGLSNAIEIANQNQRIEFLNWTVDPFLRHSTLNIFFGNGVGWLAAYGVNQATVQRYCSMSSFKKAFITVILTGPLVAFTMLLGALCGIVVFANYAGCDPITLGLIQKKDQIAPHFVVEFLSPSAGLVGLFVAALFSASLSTVSSVLNSLSAVVWEDFLKKIPIFRKFKRTSQGLVVKAIALVFTIITIGFGLVVGRLGRILPATLAITGSVAGPLLGIFILGIFFPFSNKYGAGVGMLTGLVCTFYISFGAILSGHQPISLPFRIDECSEERLQTANMTSFFGSVNGTPILSDESQPEHPIDKIFTISYMLYPLIGSSITLIIGSIISLITGPSSITDENAKYIHPALIWLRSKFIARRSPNSISIELSASQQTVKTTSTNSIADQYISKEYDYDHDHIVKNGNKKKVANGFTNNGFRT